MSIEQTAKFFKVRIIHDERFYKRINLRNFWKNQDEVNKLIIILVVVLLMIVISKNLSNFFF